VSRERAHAFARPREREHADGPGDDERRGAAGQGVGGGHGQVADLVLDDVVRPAPRGAEQDHDDGAPRAHERVQGDAPELLEQRVGGVALRGERREIVGGVVGAGRGARVLVGGGDREVDAWPREAARVSLDRLELAELVADDPPDALELDLGLLTAALEGRLGEPRGVAELLLGGVELGVEAFGGVIAGVGVRVQGLGALGVEVGLGFLEPRVAFVLVLGPLVVGGAVGGLGGSGVLRLGGVDRLVTCRVDLGAALVLLAGERDEAGDGAALALRERQALLAARGGLGRVLRDWGRGGRHRYHQPNDDCLGVMPTKLRLWGICSRVIRPDRRSRVRPGRRGRRACPSR
jgi:hypothetical protein